MRKKKLIYGLIIIISLLVFSFSFGQKKDIKKDIKKDNKVDLYINSLKNAEVTNLNNNIRSVISINNNRYESKLFNYETEEEIKIESILKKDKITDFYSKINELIYLKYPKFIADVISIDNKKRVYCLKELEMVIYFYDYEISPSVQEDLYLHVSYKEIKDYLDISVNISDKINNEDGFEVNLNKKLIAITFDDGPGEYTSSLLDILNDNKVKATFFMLGKNINTYKDTVLKAYNMGMEIGYHSYGHKSFKRQKVTEIMDEFNLSNQYLEKITGDTFHLIRPPYGIYNKNILNEMNSSFILWSVDTEDWRHRDVNYLVHYVLNHAKDGDIILFHDIHLTSVKAIQKLLPELYVNGYQVVTVSTLANSFNMAIENKNVYHNFTR